MTKGWDVRNRSIQRLGHLEVDNPIILNGVSTLLRVIYGTCITLELYTIKGLDGRHT